jgi:hypothetical protein
MGILAKRTRIRNTSYVLPDVFFSYEEYQKFHNLDLKNMETFSLRQEFFKVIAALTYIDMRRQPFIAIGPSEFVPTLGWLKARYRAIREELNRRERDSA